MLFNRYKHVLFFKKLISYSKGKQINADQQNMYLANQNIVVLNILTSRKQVCMNDIDVFYTN